MKRWRRFVEIDFDNLFSFLICSLDKHDYHTHFKEGSNESEYESICWRCGKVKDGIVEGTRRYQ